MFQLKIKKKIDRKRNKFKEIFIEKYDSTTPIRNEKLTGFVLIRKNKGKKIYSLELEDNFDKINNILKNKEVMIKNEIIQIIPLDELLNYQNEQQNYKDKIFKLQSELNKKEYNKERDNEKEKEKENKLNKEKDKQIATLKEKNDELNNIINKQEQEIDQNDKEIKQIKASYDKLKESYQNLEKENKSLLEQIDSYKHKKKVVQMQIDEHKDQQNIKEMKERIKKYKDELRKVPPVEARHRLSFSKYENPDSLLKETRPRNRHNGSMHFSRESDKKLILQSSQMKDLPKKEEEDDDDDDEDYNDGDVGDDPKAKKMKNALKRFRKKYHDVIKEEKKIQKMKEKEEKEKAENEEKEVDDNYDEENARKLNEEREKREKEEIERKEREKIEKEEKEKKEKDKPPMGGGGRPFGGGQNKMMGGNFAKMLADKLKVPPPGGKKGGGGGTRQSVSKPPAIEKNVDVVKLLQEQPFKGRKDKKKPTRKVFEEK